MLALALSAVFMVSIGAGLPTPGVAHPTPSAALASAPEVADDSLAWLTLLDNGAWDESWQAAGAMFKAQVTAEDWTTSVRSVRDPIGAVVSRVQKSAEQTSSLSGAPAGDYWILQYQTAFAERANSTETVVLAREGAGWKVIGYFVR